MPRCVRVCVCVCVCVGAAVTPLLWRWMAAAQVITEPELAEKLILAFRLPVTVSV